MLLPKGLWPTGCEQLTYIKNNQKQKNEWKLLLSLKMKSIQELRGGDDSTMKQKHIVLQNCALKNGLDSKYYMYFTTMKNNFLMPLHEGVI